MEPARKKVEFEHIEHSAVILIAAEGPVWSVLYKLGDELFALFGDYYLQLYKDGFTSGPVRWEHFPDCPVNIRCNSLGRMICQS